MLLLQKLNIRLLLFFLGFVSTLAQGPLGAPVLGTWQNPTLIYTTGGCYLDNEIYVFITSNSDDLDTIIIEIIGDNLLSVRSSTDPLTWQVSDQVPAVNVTISYIASAPNSIGTLTVSLSQPGANCSYSYQKNNTFLSGTWTLDPVNDQSDVEAEMPVSLTITDYGTYMNISLAYSNSTTESGFFYSMFGSSFGGLGYTWGYWHPLNTIFVEIETMYALYSQNGTCAKTFLGTWTDSQYDSSDSDIQSECCVPYKVEIDNTSSDYPQQLSVKAFFNSTILNLPNCSVLSLYEESDYVPLNFKSDLSTQNGGELTYRKFDNPDLGRYSVGFSAPNVLFFEFGGQYCAFTMTQNSPNPNPNPNPKFSDLLSIHIITLIFVLIGIN